MFIDGGGSGGNIYGKPAVKPKQGTATKENRGLSAAKSQGELTALTDRGDITLPETSKLGKSLPYEDTTAVKPPIPVTVATPPSCPSRFAARIFLFRLRIPLRCGPAMGGLGPVRAL